MSEILSKQNIVLIGMPGSGKTTVGKLLASALGMKFVDSDDYIEKPFEPLELMARVKAQLRRFTRYNDGSGMNQEDTLEIAGLILNRATHQCTYGEEEITLTPLEFSILWILTQNRGKVISSENLFEQVWKEKYFKNNNNTVMVHIRHLREKLGEVMGHKELIKTVWGVGYKVEE